MPDLATDLRGYLDAMVDSIDESTPPTIDLAPDQPESSHRRCRFVLAGAAAALVAIVGWAVSVDDSNNQVSTVDDPITSTTPETTSQPEAQDASPFGIGPHQEPLDPGPLEVRQGHTVVWSGEEMIVFGGSTSSGWARPDFADGAAYDPSTDTWRTIASSPFGPMAGHIGFWTGDEMVAVGGGEASDSGGTGMIRTAAAYDPDTDRWRRLPDVPVAANFRDPWAADGERLVIWDTESSQIAALDVASGTWSTLSSLDWGAVTGRLHLVDDQLVAIGGLIDGSLAAAVYDDSSGDWIISPAEDGRFDLDIRSAVTGARVLVWSNSGWDDPTLSFDTSTSTWAEEAATPVQPCEGAPEPMTIGEDVLAFGYCSRAAAFDRDENEWDAVDLGYSGNGRDAVWTGSEILSWGDACCFGTGGPIQTNLAWRMRAVPWTGNDDLPDPHSLIVLTVPTDAETGVVFEQHHALRIDSDTGCTHLDVVEGLRIIWPEGTTSDGDTIILRDGTRIEDGDFLRVSAYEATESEAQALAPDIGTCNSTLDRVLVAVTVGRARP